MIYLENVGYISDVQNLHIVEVLGSGENELNFDISTSHEHYSSMYEEMGLVYADQYYIIKSIDEQDEKAVISCRLDLDLLQRNAVIGYREENQHLYMLLNYALTGTGWSYIGADRVSIRRTTELEAGNALDLLRIAQEIYRCVFYYDAKNKVLTVFPLSAFEYKGVYFTDELNISKALLRGDSFDYCTRLIPIGAEGMKIDSINGGKSYVENYEYSTKIITKVWKDERYTDVQMLKDDAIEKLKVLSKPNRTYSLDVIDLASINSEYSHLSFKIGDKVMLVDRNRNIKVEHQVAKLTTYPDNPHLNKAELCATAKGFESVVKNLTGLIDGTNVVVNIQGRRISKLTLDFEAFTLELSNYYTRGETETYVGSQIKVEASRIDLVVNQQVTRINSLTGEVETVSHDISELSLTVGGFNTRISNAEGQVSTLSQTVSGFDTRIANAEGQVSAISQTVGGFDTRISNAEGLVSTLSQTVSGFDTRISNAEGSVSSLSQTVNGFNTRVTNAEGSITSINQSVSSITTRVTNAEGSISTINQTVSGLSTTVSNQGGSLTSINQTVSSLSTKVTIAEGNISTINQTVSSLSTTVSSHTGSISTINQNVSSITSRVSTAEGNISTVTQTANKVDWLIKSGTSSTNFTLTDRAISLVASTINLTGYVTFNNLSTSGQTTINAGNITTGTIDASKVTVDNLQINNVKYGTYPVITCSGNYGNPVVVVGRAQGSNSINPNSLSILGTTLNLGDQISSLYYTNLYGGYVNIIGGYYVNIGYSTSYYVQFNSSKEFRPNQSSGFSLGTASYPWQYGYMTNAYIGSSSYNVVINSSRELRPSYNSSSYPFYLGTSSYPWWYGYITNLYATTYAYLGTSTSSSVGFFGTTPRSRQTVAAVSTSGTLANAITGINNLITALKNYGLIY